MNRLNKARRPRRWIVTLLTIIVVVGMMAVPCLAGGNDDGGGTGDVASAVESTWNEAKEQVKTITNNVVFPVIDMVLAILFFVKVGTSYFDYRKHGQFEFTAPCILFACLLFSLTAPLYIWDII